MFNTNGISICKNSRGGILGKLVFLAIIVVIAGIAIYGVKHFGVKSTSQAMEFQKGMGYATWSKDGYDGEMSDESLAQMKNTGVEWVSILVTWYQTNCWSGDIHRESITPTDESIIHAIKKAHELGLKVMLKPHLDLLDKSDGSWRGEIGCMKETEWDEWFRKYTEYIMYYADIAEKEKVEIYCVGTELSVTATAKGYLWKELIKTVRTRYSGRLTYAAHWDRYMDIRFWDMLDFVGINAYFPMTEEMAPTYEQLKEAWGKWVTEIEDFYGRVQKPIIFPECGCNSADGAAIRPWEHAPRREVNLQLQSDYYKALLDVFWDKEWFYGLYWWYWGTNIHMGGEYNRGFTPQNKPAEALIKEYYSKKVSR
ncbi:MAG: hypothetical protein ABH883_02485 [Candidatus Omnitrophota bacterium]